ncbi:MAG: RNA recognition motif domain-containing protein [Pseudanabaena sp.]|jgi:RNA recognition motif-containing protein|uniref:RNA recognition motif domain-containing protein n=1 Tax=Pseudanabaena mucicola TaxID=71190 RepID=UPI0025791129|nr:RNA-binding protein [Pseudanabaena mucicola]MCA6525744.1 RNA-binding protein [Pseudanabaena sp. M179S2SP2A07QC]MCA6571917.1 RNA-binding protein [Pseudanabaena sp. M53BS1SP1A06MG]MCA6583619.1 RNA-binding protein [Pseudanabaena sp. M34BS1SP1A06MG]MCA6585390.1 RNA-binding protein [Pseudanabaena sp. M051S1SP1A06QC]MCA6588057.1 RNA-binding protein [Pseudanabaena sp. M109S1SP1A06QC]MCA6591682.1 RNA-binding protein [Pseudanabaena sp. M38BS1SP1A06MG]MCA6597055.1 RNA-binding protein [Pseudanabaena
MSIRLYVGNLPAELDRQALEKIFNESGDSVSLKVITDRKTGKCRGFGFVTVGSDEVADTVIEKFNGYDFNGAVLKLEKALPRTKGKGEESSNEEGTDESVKSDVESSSSVAAPVKAAAKRKKRNNNKKSTGSSSSSSASSTEAHQPDPRWASDLERLKQQLLEAQGAAK